VVLLNGSVGDRTSLGALSLVMRSEGLPPDSRWHGLPAQCVEDGDEEAGGTGEGQRAN
jgi:carbonic anhydrase/acetyltransferase-like protein (isoleucine patch superfamily)